MATILYTAQRSLIGSHIVGVQYGLDIAITDARRSRAVTKKAARSIGGNMEVIRHYGETHWAIQFEPVSGAKLEQMREFLDSTDAGELFSMDIYGTESSLTRMKRIDDGHSEDVFMRIGSRNGDYFQISITIAEVA